MSQNLREQLGKLRPTLRREHLEGRAVCQDTAQFAAIMKFLKIFWVEKVMQPYLEAILRDRWQ